MSAEVQSSKGSELPDGPPSHGDRSEARLLEPVATVVRGVYRLLLVGLVVGAVGPLVGTKLGLMWGGPNVCAESRSDFSTDGFTGRFRPRAGVEVMTRPSYCTDHADGAQRLFDFLGGFPSLLLVLGILFLLNRLIQGASREGVFTVRTAKQLRVVGWWLLLGCLAAAVVEAGAHAALLATLAQDYTFTADSWLGAWQPPYALVFTALGILTFARIMRAGVAMREDLEGTV
ncbi:DUF2975 domain-containing protein [Streptomyces sp. NPDC057747]|uniref:DUF2975 domain-containing protein n=1 Tax=Streptomyces sp. NPDC057747 TaxID=3346238 RepID=UPI0036ACA7DE